MTWQIHREKRFDKEIELLRTQGEKAAIAAKRAEEVLAKITEKGWTDLRHVAKLTDHGEHRVEGCIKYDIGGGFRLICFKRGEHLYFSYLGSHDDCHRWLNRNSKRHNQVGKREANTFQVEKKRPVAESLMEGTEAEEDYDTRVMKQLNDQLLRKVFAGLLRGLQRTP